MASNHAFGIRSQKLGSNKATKSKDKAGLAATLSIIKAESLGLRTNQSGRRRKLHEDGAPSSISAPAPLTRLTPLPCGGFLMSIPYGGGKKTEFCLGSRCSVSPKCMAAALQPHSRVQFILVQLLSRVRLFLLPWTAAHQASLSIASSLSLLKLMPIEPVMPSNRLILFFSRLQSLPASGPFQMSQLFASGDQSIGASASTSVLPMNTQD